MHSMISLLPPVIGISRTFWQTLESCTKFFLGGWKLSLSMILRIFLIFGELSLGDSYKLNSYKKNMCIIQEGHDMNCFYLPVRRIFDVNFGRSWFVWGDTDRMDRNERKSKNQGFLKKTRCFDSMRTHCPVRHPFLTPSLHLLTKSVSTHTR